MTPYESPQWQGAMVAVIGTAKSATPEVLESVRGMVRIVANSAILLAPDADMLVSIDANWPKEGDDFKGMRVVGVPCEKEAFYVGVDYERVQISPQEVVHIRNNGMLAIRLAVRAGAKKIVLVGFDPQSYQATQDAGGYDFRGYAEGLDQLITNVRAGGVEVVHAIPDAPVPKKRQK